MARKPVPLELELILTHMAQKPVLRVGACSEFSENTWLGLMPAGARYHHKKRWHLAPGVWECQQTRR